MISLGLAALVLTTKVTGFGEDFAGVWADLNGRYLYIEQQGMFFFQNGRTYHATMFKPSGDETYTCEWISSRDGYTTGEVGDALFKLPYGDPTKQSGFGTLRLGKPNGRGIIASFDVAMTMGSSAIYKGGFAYVCGLEKVTMAGHYVDSRFDLTLEDGGMKNADYKVKHLTGVLKYNNRTYKLKGQRKFIAGRVDMVDAETNKEVGFALPLWKPTEAYMTDLFNADKYDTNQISIKINLDNQTIAGASYLDIKRKRD